MFDAVGRNPERQRRRQVGALLVSLLVNGAVLTGLMLAGSGPVEAVTPPHAAPHVVEIALPKPPPAPAGGHAKAVHRTRKVETPEDVPAPVTTPPEDVPPTDDAGGDTTDDGPDGVADGVKDGVADGVTDGVPGGDPNGDPLGMPAIKRVHWSELVVKTRPVIRESDYPEAAKSLHLPDTRCVVRITVDAKGVPTSVAPTNCPEVFRDAGVNVGMRYRFQPYEIGGTATSVFFDLTLNFKP
jgi:hypothetical protein